ncbi:hypothetical protein [Algoriphagus algorifonticola]|uniref:hypothetical protein n=1 Tax=Algoriphagus algorifonticola TaxID=2593007 RepID=UPI0011A50AE3|nr:hypothetical protein [Algoriphagus algorifonticola]
MKNLLFTLLVLVLSLSTAYSQYSFRDQDISIQWDCSPQFNQKIKNTSYYTCNYQKAGEGYIFSVSVNDLSKDLARFASAEEAYKSSFLAKIKEGAISSGDKLISTGQILGQNSVQYYSITKVDAELTLKGFTAAFIVGKNAYMVNLVGDMQNPKVEAEFLTLVKSIKSN